MLSSSAARPRRTARLAALLLLLGAGCTQKYTITKDKQPCAQNCTAVQTGCTTRCAEPKQDVQVLEDIRGSLCEKRCKEDYEQCMLNCV